MLEKQFSQISPWCCARLIQRPC